MGQDQGMDNPSPCIGLCSIHGTDTCRGCGRTIDEIQNWHGMSEDEKRAVLDRLYFQETYSNG